MQGTLLFPLNQLKDVYPVIYADEVKKYAGREQVMKITIPGLDCVWNDVLHLSAINPNDIKAIFAKHGQDFTMNVYTIDPAQLDPSKTMVFLDTVADQDARQQDFVPFRIEDLSKYSQLPEQTIAYYQECFKKGIQPLIYSGVAHILYKGTIDTAGLPKKSV